jgi:hypothetical protein
LVAYVVVLAVTIIGFSRGSLWWIPTGAALLSAVAFREGRRYDAGEGWLTIAAMTAVGFLLNCGFAAVSYLVGSAVRMVFD